MNKECDQSDVDGQLEILAKKITEIITNYDFSFDDIFLKSFMLKYTNASSIEIFLLNSPYQIKTQKEVKQLPVNALDQYVYNNTPFPSWEAMHKKATKIYLANRLGLS